MEVPRTPPTPSELATWGPEQVDEVLAELWDRVYTAELDREIPRRTVERYNRKQSDSLLPYEQRSLADAEAKIRALDDRLTELHAHIGAYEAEYRRRPWSRFYLVLAANGHVHPSQSCSTCFSTTRYKWLPSLSGKDEAACVAMVGESACTVCMPSAPTMAGFDDGTSEWAVSAAEEKAAKEELKRQKEAAKQAKAITDVDGSKLKVDGWTIETLAAARMALTDTFYYASFSHKPARVAEYEANREKLVAAIAAKTGEPVETLLDAARKRAARRK